MTTPPRWMGNAMVYYYYELFHYFLLLWYFFSHFVLMADEGEDMWHVYNLIGPGDQLKASTFRKVQAESSTGSTTKTRRVRLNLTLQVESTDFDASACLLRSDSTSVIFINDM